MIINNLVYPVMKRRDPWDLWSLLSTGKKVQEVSSSTPSLFSSYFPGKAAFQPDKKSQAKLVDSTHPILKSS